MICTKSDSNNTFATFLLEYEYEFECSRIRIENRCFEFGNTFGYLLDSEDNIYQFFIENLLLQNHVKTKVLVHNRDRSLRISHSSIFILIINHIINKIIIKYILKYIYAHLLNK
jgi:hypothetical protein